VKNALAYYCTEQITAVKSFMAQGPGEKEESPKQKLNIRKRSGANVIKLFTAVSYELLQ
jgi:hypothetical protein